MRTNDRERKAVAAVLMSTCTLGSAALAADRGAVPGLEEVIVTAQKTEQDLQRTSVAVTAYGTEELAKAQIQGFEDIALRAPGFSFYALNRTQVTPALRGASSVLDAAGADQPVAIFLDEVYLGSTGDFEVDLFDLARVEVLRGPQGTVFGRNVTGGAINIVTAPPSAEPNAVVQATAGNFGRRDVKGNVTGPLSESTAGRLAFSSRNSDGWVRNEVTGHDLEQDDQWSLRGQLRWTGDALDVRLAGDYLRDQAFGQQRDLIGDMPEFTTITAGETNNDLDVDGGYDRTVWGGMLRMEWSTAAGTLTSVSGYRRNDSGVIQDADGTPVPALILSRNLDIDQFTQELRWASSADRRVTWLAGVYFFDQSADRIENYAISANPASLIGSLAGGALNNTQNRIFQAVDTRSYAGFGQATVAVTDRVKFIAGVRYTEEEKTGRSGVSGDAGLFQDDQPFAVPLSKDWGAWTPKVGLDFDIADGVFGYLSVSRGFKSGGFAVEGSNEDAFRTPFNPEYALSYETGLKTRFLDDRVQINTAVFYVEYDDLQVQTIDADTGRFFVANVGSSTSRGVEVEALAKPIPALTLAMTYSYLDAQFDEFVIQGEDLSSNTPPLSPKNTFNLSAEYALETASAGDWLFRVDYLRKSKIYFDASNFEVPENLTEFPGMVNGALSYTTPGGRWEFTLWGKNLTDEDVAIQATPNGVFNLEEPRFSAGAQSFGVVHTEPRTYGLSVTWRSAL